MRVISKARLRELWQSQGHRDAEGQLRAWYAIVNSKTVAWHTWGDVKAVYSSASLVGNCVVFNIGGNKYRLVTRILYRSQKVFILKVMTHRQYDETNWKDECGCYAYPPKSTNAKKNKYPERRNRGA